MPSLYLVPSDYPAYGLPEQTTTLAQVQWASTLIDGYLERPEGLIYGVDYLNQACYMVGLPPQATWNSAGSIPAGNAIVVPLTQAYMTYIDMIGEVVILDRGTPNLTEACVISAIAPGQITLASVRTEHSAGCTLEFGMTIFEERVLPSKRSIARVSRPPVRLISGLGRYGYGRRTDQQAGLFSEVNLLAAVQAFGGPPMWVPFDPIQASISYINRDVWIPAGLLLAYFSEVRLRYISGYISTALPPVVKQAAAQLIMAQNENPQLSGQIETVKAGQGQIQRFAASIFDHDVARMLNTLRTVPTA